MTRLLKWTPVPAAVLAMIGIWGALGFPRPAWTSDIKRLDRQQADIAAQVYQDRIRSLLSVQPPSDPVARQNWNEQLRQTRKKLDAAQERQIELSK